MAEISAQAVQTLRKKTGAGMMDCKKALAACAGDSEAAVDWLRAKGFAAASRRAARDATEGLVAAQAEGRSGVVVEINAETDFVARNQDFQNFVRTVVAVAQEHVAQEHVAQEHVAQEHAGDQTNPQAVLAAPYPGGGTVEENLRTLAATIGENLTLRRAQRLDVTQGVVAEYVHNALQPGLGKIGVLVGLESEIGEKDELRALARQLAMHVAAARPDYVTIESVDPAALQREKEVLTSQAKDSGKPPEVVERMVQGRLRKFYEEVVLAEQVFVVDGETRIKDVLKQKSETLGAPIVLKEFARFSLGEFQNDEEESSL